MPFDQPIHLPITVHILQLEISLATQLNWMITIVIFGLQSYIFSVSDTPFIFSGGFMLNRHFHHANNHISQ